MRSTELLYTMQQKKLWFQHSFAFRWAHKPLCDRFSDHVLKVGKVHVCRSCTFLYSGLLVSALSILLAPWLRENLLLVAIPLLAVTLPLSYPSVYKSFSRRLRDPLRFSLGFAISLCIALFFFGNLIVGSLVAFLGFVVWFTYGIKRTVAKSKACNGCPELNKPEICSGFTLQTDAARKYEEAATVLYLKSGKSPF